MPRKVLSSGLGEIIELQIGQDGAMRGKLRVERGGRWKQLVIRDRGSVSPNYKLRRQDMVSFEELDDGFATNLRKMGRKHY